MPDLHEAYRSVTARHYGLITSAQLDELDLDVEQRKHLHRAGHLERVSAQVWRLVGAPASDEQLLLAAVLEAGPRAALSHTTALAHWGLRSFRLRPIHVVRHRNQGDGPVPGARVHEVRLLPPEEIRVLDAIPVVSPGLALLQLAGMPTTTEERLGLAVDAAWTSRLVSYRSLRAVIDTMSERGRSGLRPLREAVETRGPRYVPPASNLEARVARIIASSGLPEFRRQVDTGDGARWIGRVDFRCASAPIVLEVQSERFHTGLTAERRDAERFAALEAAGFEVVEVTDVEVFHTPWVLISRLRSALERARSRVLAR